MRTGGNIEWIGRCSLVPLDAENFVRCQQLVYPLGFAISEWTGFNLVGFPNGLVVELRCTVDNRCRAVNVRLYRGYTRQSRPIPNVEAVVKVESVVKRKYRVNENTGFTITAHAHDAAYPM